MQRKEEVVRILQRINRGIRTDFEFSKYRAAIHVLENLRDMKIINEYEFYFWENEFSVYSIKDSHIRCGNIWFYDKYNMFGNIKKYLYEMRCEYRKIGYITDEKEKNKLNIIIQDNRLRFVYLINDIPMKMEIIIFNFKNIKEFIAFSRRKLIDFISKDDKKQKKIFSSEEVEKVLTLFDENEENKKVLEQIKEEMKL